MTETNEIPAEPDLTPGQQAYQTAYDKVVGQHVMAEPNKDRLVRCSCGDQGDVVDMAGHFGAEADRAGAAAQEAYARANP